MKPSTIFEHSQENYKQILLLPRGFYFSRRIRTKHTELARWIFEIMCQRKNFLLSTEYVIRIAWEPQAEEVYDYYLLEIHQNVIILAQWISLA